MLGGSISESLREFQNDDLRSRYSRITGRGEADILVVPDLDTGNMLTKQPEYLGGARLAGIVMGAKFRLFLPAVPIRLNPGLQPVRGFYTCACAVKRSLDCRVRLVTDTAQSYR